MSVEQRLITINFPDGFAGLCPETRGEMMEIMNDTLSKNAPLDMKLMTGSFLWLAGNMELFTKWRLRGDRVEIAHD